MHNGIEAPIISVGFTDSRGERWEVVVRIGELVLSRRFADLDTARAHVECTVRALSAA